MTEQLSDEQRALAAVTEMIEGLYEFDRDTQRHILQMVGNFFGYDDLMPSDDR